MAGILLFRQEALNKLSAPEELDAAVGLVGPASWLALAALAIITTAIMLWALLGMTYRMVDGVGVIQLRDGGRIAHLSVTAPAALSVRVGQPVSIRVPGLTIHLQGRVLAVADAPMKSEQLEELAHTDPRAAALAQSGQLVAVDVALPPSASGSAELVGYSVHATIIGEAIRPIELLFPGLFAHRGV
jgi:hypothetical protein